MKYGLLVKKLNLEKEKIITRSAIREYCKILDISYASGISYLIRTRHVYTILRGIFYIPSITERKIKKIEIFHLDALVKALEIKGVNNWYFGLESAIKMNGLTHEYYTLDTVINDKIFRKNPVKVFGNKIRFIKVKPSLLIKGVIRKNNLRFSNVEKTVLDMIYLEKYNGKSEKEILNSINVYLPSCKKKRLRDYAKYYNKKIIKFVGEL